MFKRAVGWLVLVPLSVVLIVFALANRHIVDVGIDPISPSAPFTGPFPVPLFVVFYAMLLAGCVLGGAATWFAQGRNRADRRHFKREVARMSRALDLAQRTPEPLATGAPALITDPPERD